MIHPCPALRAAAPALALALLAATAVAQPLRDPADPSAPVPPLTHASTLRLPAPVETRGWREAHELVGRIGGWRAYAREAAGTPATAASATPEPRRKAAP